jgi:hypothetical protein
MKLMPSIDLATFIYNDLQKFCSNNTSDDYDEPDYIYIMPIKKLFDINIIARIIIYRPLSIREIGFVIEAENIYSTNCEGEKKHKSLYSYNKCYSNYDNNYLALSISYLNIFITNIYYNLHILQLDIVDGIFRTEKCIHERLTSYNINGCDYEQCSGFISSDYILIINDSNINICCICFKYTLTMTECKHTLCIKCNDNIAFTENNIKKCPRCRISLNIIICKCDYCTGEIDSEYKIEWE